MKSCYIAMPFGIKADPSSGMVINFDKIYEQLIVPALQDKDYLYFRNDLTSASSNLQKSMIQSILTSDIMIADLSTLNANVFYELGIRHMAQRGLTLMICSSGTPIPSNISNYKVISYQLNADGSVSEPSRQSFQQLLRYSIDSQLDQLDTDSPVYQFFPTIQVNLPVEIVRTQERMARKIYKPKSASPGNFGTQSFPTKRQSLDNLKEIQSDAFANQDQVDPNEFIALLKNYRDLSAWGDLAELAETLPEAVKKSPEVQQLYALALNRLGDHAKAIDLMDRLILQTGGDAESFGILGRIYKDLYEKSKLTDGREETETLLRKAIDNYRAGFEKQPNDYYTGVNVVNLLMQLEDPASHNELAVILPKVRLALNNKMTDTLPNYWDYSSSIELACIEKDWDLAELDARKAIALFPDSWMLNTTLKNLTLLAAELPPSEVSRLSAIISILESNIKMKEGLPYAQS